MAEEQNPNTESQADNAAQAQFQIQTLYTKDVSFESPNSPKIFQEPGQADIKMSLSQRVDELGEDLYEVVLTVTITAAAGEEKTAYLVEVAQAGIFLISGFNEQARHAVLNTLCPNALFPYSRQIISSLVANGGFPPLILQPMNFEQLYAQRMQELANQGEAGAMAEEDEPVAAEFPDEQ